MAKPPTITRNIARRSIRYKERLARHMQFVEATASQIGSGVRRNNNRKVQRIVVRVPKGEIVGTTWCYEELVGMVVS